MLIRKIQKCTFDSSSVLTNAVFGSQRHKIESSGFFPIDVLCRRKKRETRKTKTLKMALILKESERKKGAKCFMSVNDTQKGLHTFSPAIYPIIHSLIVH